MIAAFKSALKKRLAKLRAPGLQLGSGVRISQCHFGKHVRIGRDAALLASEIGDFTYLGDRTSLAHAEVGRFCSIGSDVAIGSGTHPTRDWVSTHPIFYLARPSLGWNLVKRDRLAEFGRTIVGNDVWIGAKVLLLDGITIGDGAILGGGSVVLKDVEPYAIYAGVPAKLVRYRFDREQISFLLDLKWWSRDLNWLKKHADSFSDVNYLRGLFSDE